MVTTTALQKQKPIGKGNSHNMSPLTAKTFSRISKVLLLSLAVLTLRSQVTFGSALSDLAKTMQAGQWAQLTVNGQTPSLFIGKAKSTEGGGECPGNIMEYGGKGVWDSQTKRFYYLGTSHTSGTFCAGAVRYDEATNTWSVWPEVGGVELGSQWEIDTSGTGTATAHIYDHQAGNYNGRYWVRGQYPRNVCCRINQYNTATGQWSLLPNSGREQSSDLAASIVFFPNLGSQGSLIDWSPYWGVWRFDFASGTWSLLANTIGGGSAPTTLSPIGGLVGETEYSSVHGVVVRCGGNDNPRVCWRLNSNGTFTRLADAPVNIGAFGLGQGHMMVDPSTGNFIVLGPDGSLWSLNPTGSGAWSQIVGASNPCCGGLLTVGGSASDDNNAMTFAAIPEYGVIMVVTKTKTLLFKPSTGVPIVIPPATADTTAPTTPAGLVATALSSSQISIAWNASTDNVGVAGYRVYRNGAQVATVVTTNYQDGGLAPATSYNYTVAAYDAAGNVSQQSSQASATTSQSTTVISDFQTRCSAAGVVRCVGFDSVADISGGWGSNTGILPIGNSPVLDSTIKASGNSSLKFIIGAGSNGANAGSYFANFSSDLSVRFAENSEFFVQWRQRFSPEFINPGAGWKQTIIGTGDIPGCTPSTTVGYCASSCTPMEVVSQNTDVRGFPQMYNACGWYVPFNEPFGSGDWKLQNARPYPYCLYSQWVNRVPLSQRNCVIYYPNEWMTFQVGITLGPRQILNGVPYFTNSRIRMWVAREGQPAELAIDILWNLNAESPLGLVTPNPTFGKVWLLPYSADPFPQTAYTWYDELIISRSRIPDPTGGTTVVNQPPVAPTGLVLQ